MRKNTPNFLVVGVMKGSTSAAAYNLNQHDDVFCLTSFWKAKVNAFYGYNKDNYVAGLSNEGIKEMDFFNSPDNYNNGKDFYESYFPQIRTAIGEASPNYFHSVNENNATNTIKNIQDTIGNPKIVILLRDPITRAFSHWNMIQANSPDWGTRFIGKSFNECTENMSNDNSKNAILKRSSYFDNIVKFRNAFGNNNIYIALQESIKANPAAEYNKIFNFLGVSERPLDAAYNQVHTASYSSTLDEPTKTWLASYFKSDVDALKGLYPNLDYSRWNNY